MIYVAAYTPMIIYSNRADSWEGVLGAALGLAIFVGLFFYVRFCWWLTKKINKVE